MSGTHTTLDAAATDRKARLAKLASLKRKQPDSDNTVATLQSPTSEDAPTGSKTDVYLSGRNYDVQTKGPKLGFENIPHQDQDTVEAHAEKLSLSAAEQASKDEAEAEKGIDLFKLQPKKPNWDLKRDLAERTKVLDVRTQNAIARLVRERIENAKKEALKKGKAAPDGQGEEVGMEGTTLVEGVHMREKEEEEEERRERELEEEEAVP